MLGGNLLCYLRLSSFPWRYYLLMHIISLMTEICNRGKCLIRESPESVGLVFHTLIVSLLTLLELMKLGCKQINLASESIKSSLESIESSLESIESSLESIKSSLESIESSLESIESAIEFLQFREHLLLELCI